MASRSRREFLKDAGGLIVGFSLANSAIVPQLLAQTPLKDATSPTPDRLDAWLRIAKDGTVQVFTGKMDVGSGVQTAFSQIVAEELDIAPQNVTFVMADTAMTPDQGGTGASSSIAQGSKPLRVVAATTRFLLLQLASSRLGVPVEQLQVKNGVVTVNGNESRSVSYAVLVEQNNLNDALKVSGAGFAVNVEGKGKPKDPATYTIVGKSIPRVDLPPKILGQYTYVTDIRVPAMLHARVIRPSRIGASLLGFDETSVKRIPGFLKTVAKGNFLGVVAQTEWAAIRAARELKVNWSSPQTTLPEDLYQYMRTTTPKSTQPGVKRGDAAAALSRAAMKLEARYEWPFQSHSTMGPGCAVADFRADGVTTIWSGTQKSHDLQRGIADLLKVPVNSVRIVWAQDSGSYGRPGFDDVAADAALLSQIVGKPIRVQWMRSDMTAWGTKGPAVIMDLAGGLDTQGQVIAIQASSRAYSGAEVHFLPNSAGDFLAGQLTGIANTTGADEFVQWEGAYEFQNISSVANILPAFQSLGSPLRTTHFRDPQGPARSFACESFVDELAAAAGVDPIEFRLKYLSDARSKAVLTAAADRAGWDSRPSPKRLANAADIVTGRGVAHCVRAGTYVATVAEVEITRRTGAIRVKRLVCAHDCGFIVNPDAVRGHVAGNLIQSLSRSLKEEVTFDRSKVTSVDWNTYRVARASDIPDQVDIVLLNNPDIPSSGAGEASTRPTGAAINNAIFDATGARLRQGPLTPAKIKAALGKL